MNVLHIGLSETLGGIERFLFNVYNNKSNDIDMDFVTTSEHFRYNLSNMIINGNDYRIFRVAKLSSPFQHMVDIYHIIKENHYDVVHIHKNSLANPLEIIAARLAGTSAIIVHSHNTQPSGHRQAGVVLHTLNKMWIPYLATKRLACSELAGEWLFASHPYQVIHNAINLDDFCYNPDIRNQKRREFHLEDCFVIGSVARISDQKNQLFMLDVMKYITEHCKTAKLFLIGGKSEAEEGCSYFAQVNQKINDLHLENNVKLLGSREDVKDLYQMFDVYLQPSKYEGLCISAIEAQASGLPCVVSDVLSEETKVTKEYVALSLNQPPEEWGKKILALRGIPRINQRDNLVKAGYSMHEEISMLESVYRSLVE